MAIAEFLHGLFVLITNFTYALPIYEGYKRQSAFYVILFVCLCAMSFALHCEETGICNELAPRVHVRLQTADLALSYYLLNIMMMVVLEIKNEVPARIATAVLTVALTARNIMDLKFNIISSAALAAILLVIDIIQFKRKFTPAWWRRLALIAGMAAIGAVLFRMLKSLWAVHGLWHVYYVTTCYLLLLAQRYKRQSRSERGSGNSLKTSGHSTSTADGMGLSTPLKRKAGGQEGDGDMV